LVKQKHAVNRFNNEPIQQRYIMNEQTQKKNLNIKVTPEELSNLKRKAFGNLQNVSQYVRALLCQ
jgi:hypothetical protein